MLSFILWQNLTSFVTRIICWRIEQNKLKRTNVTASQIYTTYNNDILVHHCNDIYIGLETGYNTMLYEQYPLQFTAQYFLCALLRAKISRSLDSIFTSLCYLLGNDDNDDDSDLGWRPFPLTNCAHSLTAQSLVKGRHDPMVTAPHFPAHSPWAKVEVRLPLDRTAVHVAIVTQGKDSLPYVCKTEYLQRDIKRLLKYFITSHLLCWIQKVQSRDVLLLTQYQKPLGGATGLKVIFIKQ